MSRYLSQYASAYKLFQEGSGVTLTSEQGSILDLAAKETITKEDLDSALDSGVGNVTAALGGADGSMGLVRTIASLSGQLAKMNDKMVNFNALVEAFSGAKDLYARVESSIISDGGSVRAKSKNRSKVMQEVVTNILRSPDGSAWNSASHGHVETIEGLGKTMNQWLVMLYAVASRGVRTGTAYAAKQAILEGIKQYAVNLENAVLDVGSALTDAQASSLAARNINDLDDEIEKRIADSRVVLSGASSVQCEVKMERDSYLKELLKQSPSLSVNEESSRGTSLVSVKLPDTTVRSQQQVWSGDMQLHYDNISVKSTVSERTLQNGEKRIGEIKLQSSTSLQTVLLRELRFGAQETIGLVQIALARDDEDVTAYLWDKLKQYVQIAMLVPALSGLNRGNSLDALTTKIKINDYLIPMPQLLNYLQFALAKQAVSYDGLKFTGSLNLKGFPSIGKFISMNEWVAPREPDVPAAMLRSKHASASGFDLLQSAKLTLRLRNINLSLLLKAGALT